MPGPPISARSTLPITGRLAATLATLSVSLHRRAEEDRERPGRAAPVEPLSESAEVPGPVLSGVAPAAAGASGETPVSTVQHAAAHAAGGAEAELAALAAPLAAAVQESRADADTSPGPDTGATQLSSLPPPPPAPVSRATTPVATTAPDWSVLCLADMLVAELLAELSVLRSAPVIVTYLRVAAALQCVPLSPRAAAALEASLYAFSTPGGPHYPSRMVRDAARAALAVLRPQGLVARVFVRSLFRLVRPWYATRSALHTARAVAGWSVQTAWRAVGWALRCGRRRKTT
jgi:hypothetical protein